MYRRILVPLDGSALAEQVLPHALLLADRFKAATDLVCAVEVEDIPENVIAEARKDREEYLRRIAATLPQGVEARCIVEQGSPAEVILDQAESGNGDLTLIVMATHGYSGLQRWILGSVAHKVVQAAATPVLLIPAGAKNPEGGPVEFDRVIVPLDGSKVAEHILPFTVALCKTLDLEMILLRAYNPGFPGSTIRMHEVSGIVHDAAESYLKKMIGELASTGLKKLSYEVLRGIPAEQITNFALETPNSITAMSTHGRHGVGRWVLGSVTDAVIHSSAEPVFVVRAPHQTD